MSFPTLILNPKLEGAIERGHPWIYRDHLPKNTLEGGQLEGGEWVKVEAGRAEAYGLYDLSSPIALRMFGTEEPRAGMITRRVETALELRASLFDPKATNAYRLLNGEGDFLPGITVDKYERYAVLATYANALERLILEVVKGLTSSLKLKGIVRRLEGKLEPLWGELPPPELTILENGLKIIANLYDGQKTGLFLDHRDNRFLLERVSRNKTVLNLFSYTGAFSLYCARGGATRVTSVDIAPLAIEDARRNFTLNGFDPLEHEFLAEDCFALLERYAQEGRKFDLVILDPPSLARTKENRHAAARAYKKLNTLALRCVAPGGLLASASCTSQISSEHFKEILLESALEGGVRMQILQENGQAPDHPVPVSFPEGRYLKFVLGRVLKS
ncbi:MAG: class I SAM-dependent rRNA methyltransferase [Pseudopedobacter sp.]|nr:class I SAM-dependent rRNA methyltransferase [Deinococcales bacterium]